MHSGYQRIRVSSFQFVFCCETRILILTHQWYLLIRIHQYISTSSPLFARGRFSHEIDSLLTTGYRQTTMMALDGNWWKNWNLSLAESMTSADIIWQKNWTASDRPRPMSEKKSGQTQKRPKNRNRKPGLAHTECRWPRLACVMVSDQLWDSTFVPSTETTLKRPCISLDYIIDFVIQSRARGGEVYPAKATAHHLGRSQPSKFRRR